VLRRHDSIIKLVRIFPQGCEKQSSFVDATKANCVARRASLRPALMRRDCNLKLIRLSRPRNNARVSLLNSIGFPRGGNLANTNELVRSAGNA
jgi:hypothetical protein